jgi:hypothetical protein
VCQYLIYPAHVGIVGRGKKNQFRGLPSGPLIARSRIFNGTQSTAIMNINSIIIISCGEFFLSRAHASFLTISYDTRITIVGILSGNFFPCFLTFHPVPVMKRDKGKGGLDQSA